MDNNLDIIVICSFKDHIKFFNIYVPLGDEIILDYIKEGEKLGYKVSHGLAKENFKKYYPDLYRLKLEEEYKKIFKIDYNDIK